MARSAEQVEASITNMRKVGWVLSAVFSVLLVLFGAFVLYVIWRLATDSAGPLHDGLVETKAGGIVYLFPALILVVIFGAVLVILQGISADIAHGVSPFTRGHASRIFVLGIAFLANTAAAFVVPGGSIDLVAGPVQVTCFPHSMMLYLGTGAIPLDAGSLLGAVICFAIAAIWRYGALLQEQTEDLV